MSEIDRTIQGVEQLYRSLTGHAPMNGETVHEVIPPEVDPARYVEEQLGRLMSLLGETPSGEAWTPALALWETSEAYLANLDLAGVSRDALRVSVTGQGILVEGTRSASRGALPTGASLRYRELPFGECRRLVAFPPDAKLDLVEAKLADGLLQLLVPRAATPRAIPVR
jgi:HSP20 family molecular chaperone IbpA